MLRREEPQTFSSKKTWQVIHDQAQSQEAFHHEGQAQSAEIMRSLSQRDAVTMV